MDTVWIELIKALPWGFVILVLQYMNLRDKKEERLERALHAAERAKQDKEFDMEKNRLWMETIKNSMDAYKNIVLAIETMQKDLQDKYDSMGITKDLLDAARRELARDRRKDQ